MCDLNSIPVNRFFLIQAMHYKIRKNGNKRNKYFAEVNTIIMKNVDPDIIGSQTD